MPGHKEHEANAAAHWGHESLVRREEHEEMFRRIKANRRQAHELLFAHRKPERTVEPHNLIIDHLWSAAPRAGCYGFRGLGKSTLAEEMIALAACELFFKNCVIVGSNEARAAERLAAIKRELEQNEMLLTLYMGQLGAPWTQTKIVTAHDVCVQALGRDQDVRGIKHLDARPDLVLLDDFEDRENLATVEQQRKTLVWFFSDLLPACTPDARVRVLATPNEEGVPMKLKSLGWPWLTLPISRISEDGSEEPLWPERFSGEWIERTRNEYLGLGLKAQWESEYMCRTLGPGDREFVTQMIRVEPRLRSFQATYAMVDPARTVNRETSAMTGIVVWSWAGNELIVWEDKSGFWRPSEIIERIFEIDEAFSPVVIGVERDGLEEFIMQPLRAEQLKRGRYVPVEAVRAPRGKTEFIRGLQPFFEAGEVIFAKELPTLKQHLLAVGTNARIDAANALAYAVPMRPGLPVYDGFRPAQHVESTPLLVGSEPSYLALGCEAGLVTGVLFGQTGGRLLILRDFVQEGDPFSAVPDIVRSASMEARAYLRVIAAPEHFDEWNNKGLAQAVRGIPAEIRQGSLPAKGREYLRREFGRLVRGMPAVRVSVEARRVLNGFAAGFAIPHGKDEPARGLYRTLFEPLESAVGLMSAASQDDSSVNWYVTADGRRYRRYASGSEARH